MNRWDIYWADVPFEEDPFQSKRRPVIIARNKVIYALVLRVTSHDVRKDDPYDYPLQEWEYANLSKESVVRIRKIAQIKPEHIHEYIGKLHPVDILEIQEHMRKYQESRRRK